MPTAFRLVALPLEPFQPLFALTDAQLIGQGARRVTADTRPGFPCRVSLTDAAPGETLILLPFEHQPADSPYRASGPVFVREAAQQAFPSVNELPDYVRRRLISIRAYDAQGRMTDAEVCPGSELEIGIDRLFADPRVLYLHLHNAHPGCYSCRVNRA